MSLKRFLIYSGALFLQMVTWLRFVVTNYSIAEPFSAVNGYAEIHDLVIIIGNVHK